jgi:hypothetical protein
MRKYLTFAMAAVALVAWCGVAQAVWNPPDPGWQVFGPDSFDDLSAYTEIHPLVPMALDPNKGYTASPSVQFGPNNNSEQRGYVNLGGKWPASDEFPLVVRFAMDTELMTWHTREYVELRAYVDGAYAQGGLQDLLALGFTSSGVDTTRINYRILSGPQPGWFNYTANYATRQDVVDRNWTRVAMVIRTSEIDFYVDDANGVLQLDTTHARNPNWEYDSLVIGSGLSTLAAVWMDDLSVHYIPEPATLGLLALGLPFLRRRRTA